MENEFIDKMFNNNLIHINGDLQYSPLKTLFGEIQSAYNNLNRLTITRQDSAKGMAAILSDIQQHSGNYLPIPIIDSIKQNYLGTMHVVEVDIGPMINTKKCDIKLSFYKMSDNPIMQNTLELYSNVMISWLIVAKKYEGAECLKNLTVDIYLTKERKLLNTNVGELYDANGGTQRAQQTHGNETQAQQTHGNETQALGSNNVNTALTYRCVHGKSIILLYRSEDLIKTFFHETFHTLSLDFENAAKKEVKHIFNINSPLRLFESYCETWARIVNSMYYVILLNPNMKWQAFNKNFKVVLSIESIYSAIQCCKILNYMDLTYDDVLSNNVFDKFKETSNVFSYYVITAIIMMNPTQFLSFCNNDNNILKFNKSKLQEYIQFLSKARYTSNIKTVETHLDKFTYKKSLRMAIFDIKN